MTLQADNAANPYEFTFNPDDYNIIDEYDYDEYGIYGTENDDYINFDFTDNDEAVPLLNGFDGNDVIYSPGALDVYGADGDDVIFFNGPGAYGDDGDDILVYVLENHTTNHPYMEGGPGDDHLYAADLAEFSGGASMWGDDGDDFLYGGDGDDWISTGWGNDFVSTGAG